MFAHTAGHLHYTTEWMKMKPVRENFRCPLTFRCMCVIIPYI